MASYIDQPLDQNGTLVLRITHDNETNTLSGQLIQNSTRHLHGELARNVAELTTVRIGETILPLEIPSYSFTHDLDSHSLPGSIDVNIGNQVFGSYKLSQTGEITGGHQEQLVAFETRLIAGGKEIMDMPLDRQSKPEFRPITDLHTHLAGNLPASKLIEVGLNKQGKPIEYPVQFLTKAGIDPDKYPQSDKKTVVLNVLDQEDLKKLEAAMEIGIDERIIPSQLNGIYAIRGPITKDKDLFADMLLAIAEDYASQGTKYAELSHASIVADPDLIRIAHEVLPGIEDKTGVKLRFLAGVWRHADKEWNQDEIDKIKSISRSPYVVGVDFMGNETNPTRDIADEIKAISKWAIENDPDFTVRIHAGENALLSSALFKSATETKDEYHNVKESLIAVIEAREELAKERGVPVESLKFPRVRIGHGLYGIDDESIALMKQVGAIVEFNMSSNLALNNINNIHEIPVALYLQAGIPVVLGYDGKGTYQTNAEQEALLARAAGITPEQFSKIAALEHSHIATDQEVFKRKSATFDTALAENGQDYGKVFKPVFSTTDGSPHWTKAISERKAAETAQQVTKATALISACTVVTSAEEIQAMTATRTPILITGASKTAWGTISPDQQREVSITMQMLADLVDPKKTYFVTGGTNYGAEKELHVAAARSNAEREPDDKVPVLGTLTLRVTSNERNNAVERNTISHGMVIHLGNKPVSRWADLPDASLELIEKHKGIMLAIGGSATVSNMIQRGHNMGIPMILMDGPEGASTDKAKVLRGNGYEAEGAIEVVRNLHSKNPSIFPDGFDIAKLDTHYETAKAKIDAPGLDMSQARGTQPLAEEKRRA